MDELQPYLSGSKLYGDDFTPEEIAAWYADEKEGYANLGAGDRASYRYAYDALNRFHAYRHLPDVQFEHVLGFGSAYGDEFRPIIDRVKALTIVDASDAFVSDTVCGVPATYVKPQPIGDLPFAAATFDLITCLGVLHHIPNVSHVFGEIARTLRPGGYLLVREPIVSMGDWRKPRHGLTKRERGIPFPILHALIERNGLNTIRVGLCAFPVTPRLFRSWKGDVYNSSFATWFDSVASKLFSWNVNYHPRNALQRFRPTSAFFLVGKE